MPGYRQKWIQYGCLQAALYGRLQSPHRQPASLKGPRFQHHFRSSAYLDLSNLEQTRHLERASTHSRLNLTGWKARCSSQTSNGYVASGTTLARVSATIFTGPGWSQETRKRAARWRPVIMALSSLSAPTSSDTTPEAIDQSMETTFPGLRIFSGSSVRFSVFINSISAADLLIGSQSFFSIPMPCSAEMAPA